MGTRVRGHGSEKGREGPCHRQGKQQPSCADHHRGLHGTDDEVGSELPDERIDRLDGCGQ